MVICLSALCIFWIHVAIRRTWSILKNKNIQISRHQKSRRFKKKKWQEPALLDACQQRGGVETGDSRNQISQPFAIRDSLSRLCIPHSGREWAQPQLLPKQHRVSPCTRSRLSLQELPGLSGTAGTALQHRHSPNKANATFLLPSSYITLPVGNDTANWWSRSRHPNSSY